jgi:hypothetical protein
MKKLTILLLLTSSVYGQKFVDSLYTFKVVDNSKIVWQKIFTNEIDDLQNAFKKEVISNLQLDNLQEIKNTITFNVKDEYIDYKKYGGKWGNTPAVLNHPHNFLVIIDFKDNRYRVTVKSIEAVIEAANMKMLYDDFLSRGKIKNNKSNKLMYSYIHKYLIDKFTIKLKNDDW